MSGSRPHVVVVGAGPVGLSAALLLHRHGVRCTVLERDLEPSQHPKARGIRTRTMELFSQWGLAGQLQRQGMPEESNRFIYCDSLAGEEIARSPRPDALTQRASLVGPCRVSQAIALRALLDAVAELDEVTVRMGCEVVELDDAGDRVVVSSAIGETIEADYLIAADGAASTVRRLLGIELDGDAVLGYGQSIYWRGDLARWTHDRMCIQFITGHRTGQPSNIAPVDGTSHWVTMVMQPPSGSRPAEPTPGQAVAIIQAAVGAPITPEIIDITTWRISALVARRWRAGRVFLAGDAAHSFPPTGGFGMNTGVQDVHNLVWKLALVLDGKAGDALLDTYESERIDIARSNAAWSVANGGRMRDIGTAIAEHDPVAVARLLQDQLGHIDATDQDLGFGYGSGALVGEDRDTDRSPLRHARLGHRFPEATVLVDGEKRSSTLDLGDAFTLVVADATHWREAAAGALRRGIPMALADVTNDVLAAHAAALVRPDGIVGWLGDSDDQGAVGEVLAQLTGVAT